MKHAGVCDRRGGALRYRWVNQGGIGVSLLGCWLTLGGVCGAGNAADAVRAQSPGAQPAVSGQREVDSAYYEGDAVAFTVVAARKSKAGAAASFNVGPWRYGARVHDPRPSDRRPNLYLVSPGTQHLDPRWEQYDHNTVVNLLPGGEGPAEWDVYWAVVLDPALQHDFRSERELLLAAQSEFEAGERLEFSEIPGRSFLRSFLRITSAAKLERFRRRNGRMPRLIIVPAGFAIRATAAQPEAKAFDAEDKAAQGGRGGHGGP